MSAELDPRLRRLPPSMAGSVLAAAPDEWSRATYKKVEVTGGSQTMRLSFDTADGRESRSADVGYEVVMALAELADGYEAGFDVELTVRPDGDYEALVTMRGATGLTEEDAGYLYTFDPDHRPPPYRGPEPDETGPRDPSQAGDPGEIASLIRDYLSRVHAIFGEPPGRTDEERPDGPEDGRRHLDALERRAGVRLPADLRAAYEQAWDPDHQPFYPWSWLPPDWLDDELTQMREITEWPGWRLGWNKVACDASPPGAVRRVTSHPAWIPFCKGPDRSYFAVDMSPGPEGRPGQVIGIGHLWPDGAEYVADSVTTMVRNQLAALERGDCEADTEEMTLSLHGEEFEFGRTEAAREWRGKAADLTPDAVTPSCSGCRSGRARRWTWTCCGAPPCCASCACTARAATSHRCATCRWSSSSRRPDGPISRPWRATPP